MAKTKKKLPLHKRGYHKKLEEPVHSTVGYLVLLMLTVVVLVLVYSLGWFVTP